MLAVCASAALLVIPTASTGYESSVVVGGQEVSRTPSHTSLTILEQGPPATAFVLLLVPIVLTALPVLLRHRPWVGDVRRLALLLMLLILHAGFVTQGGFYLPSAVALVVAIVRDRADDVVVDDAGLRRI